MGNVISDSFASNDTPRQLKAEVDVDLAVWM